MAYDFPNAPSEGAIYAPAGGPQYTYTNGAWRMIGVPTPIVATADSYNRTVNGAMQHSQENGDVGTAALASSTGYYSADQTYSRWNVSPGAMSTSRHASLLSPNGARSIVLSTNTAKASLAALDYALFTHLIEGNRIIDLKWGSVSARQVVVRFQVRAEYTGKFSFRLANSAVDRCYVHQFDITAANTWTTVTAIITGDVSGTWVTDAGIGLRFEICVGAGSTYTGSTVDAWQAGNFFAGPGQSNGVANAAMSFLISELGIYADPNNTGVPPPWVTPDYASELAACQRYWENARGGADGYGVAGTPLSYRAYFKQPKRTNPTVSAVSAIVTNASATPTADSATVNTFRIYRTVTATGNAGFSEDWIANARM